MEICFPIVLAPGLVVNQETESPAPVDAIPVQLHIARAVPDAFFQTGGTMRMARKTRQVKSIYAAESAESSAIAIIEPAENLEAALTQAIWAGWTLPQGLSRVPTHAVTVPNERRSYARANLRLPVRILRIAGRRELHSSSFITMDISSSGLRALCPIEIELGTPVNLEVELVRRAAECGTVKLISEAHVVRAKPEGKPGWHALAFNFDDITFERDDLLPPCFVG